MLENISKNKQIEKIIEIETSNFSCWDCPVKAHCTTLFKSNSNFYGYKPKKQKLKFLPCQRGFCCTGNQCNRSLLLTKNRVGSLYAKSIQEFGATFLNPQVVVPNIFVLPR